MWLKIDWSCAGSLELFAGRSQWQLTLSEWKPIVEIRVESQGTTFKPDWWTGVLSDSRRMEG